MSADNPAQRYWVILCAKCAHPGGQHRELSGCVLCQCSGWQEGPKGRWSDLDTQRAQCLNQKPTLAPHATEGSQ